MTPGGARSDIAESLLLKQQLLILNRNIVDQPAALIGMDALDLLDTLIIDYRLHELRINLVGGS